MAETPYLIESLYKGESRIDQAILNDLAILREVGRIANAESTVEECINYFMGALRCRWDQENQQNASKSILQGLKDYCQSILSAQTELIRVDRGIDTTIATILFEDDLETEEEETDSTTTQVLDTLYDMSDVLKVAAHEGTDKIKDTAVTFLARLTTYEKKYGRYIKDIKSLQNTVELFRKVSVMEITDVQTSKEVNTILDSLKQALSSTNKEVRETVKGVSYAVTDFMKIHTDFIDKYPVPFQLMPVATKVYCDRYEVKDILIVYRNKLAVLFKAKHKKVRRSREVL